MLQNEWLTQTSDSQKMVINSKQQQQKTFQYLLHHVHNLKSHPIHNCLQKYLKIKQAMVIDNTTKKNVQNFPTKNNKQTTSRIILCFNNKYIEN
jgi:hypothetical protein